MTYMTQIEAPAGRGWPYVIRLSLFFAAFFVIDNHATTLFQLFSTETRGWTRAGHAALLWYGALAGLSVLVMILLVGWNRTKDLLGLHRRVGLALTFAFCVSLLMPAILAMASPPTINGSTVLVLLHDAVMPGISEEIVFRAFLFGMLHYFFGWRFLPAALAGAVIFASAHLYQSDELTELAFILLYTGVGGVWFAWLYRAWSRNLWVPIGFHAAMNGWWSVFEISDTAAGPVIGVVARLAVVVASVVGTIWIVRRRERLDYSAASKA